MNDNPKIPWCSIILRGMLVYVVIGLFCFAAYSTRDQQPHPTMGAARSGHWPKVRAAHLAAHPACEITGATENVEVHHVRPFHDHPELELDPSNLITLRRDLHFIFGHLCDWKSHNPDVREDAAVWREKIKNRP